MFMRSRAGVTIPQVAATFAIVAFLSAILFPVFQRHGGNNPRASCASNLKQLGVAMSQYSQDYDENLLPSANAAGNGWAGELYEYAKSASVYHCRNDAQSGSYVSYAANRNLAKQTYANLSASYATVALYESTTLNCDPATAETVSATGLSAPQDSKRHEGGDPPYGLNFLAVDGHVKFLTPERVSGGPHAVPAKGLPSGKVAETFAVK